MSTPLNEEALVNLRQLADRATEEERHAVIEPAILHKLLDMAAPAADKRTVEVVRMRDMVAEAIDNPGESVHEFVSLPDLY